MPTELVSRGVTAEEFQKINNTPCKQAANTKRTGISWAGLAANLAAVILARDFVWDYRAFTTQLILHHAWW